MKRYKSIFQEYGPLAGPQRGSTASSHNKEVDALDLELKEFQDKYLNGKEVQKYRHSSDGSKIYKQAAKLEKQGKISFALLGYIYNLIW